MPTYYGDNGITYVMSDKIAEGGAGIVYKIQGNDREVAKIFKKREKQRDLKVKALRQLPWSPEMRNYAVLPEVVLYEDSRNTVQVGFIMENVDASCTLADAYSERHPLTIRKKAVVAENLCRAVIAVHNSGRVCIGDFNAKNITVNRITGKIRIIDPDSYHLNVHIGGRPEVLPCTELDPILYMPELLRLFSKYKGSNLESLSNLGFRGKEKFETFTRYTDYFCLAYHIHMLLLASTPFGRAVDTSVVNGSVKLPTPQSMANNGQYCYVNLPARAKLPDNFPDFDVITPELQNLFIRAFRDGASDPSKRPTAQEFLNALEKYIADLNYCECYSWDHYLHKRYNKGYCEWCRIEHTKGQKKELEAIDILTMTNNELLYFSKLASNGLKAIAFYECGLRRAGKAFVNLSGLIDMPVDKREAKKYMKEAIKLAPDDSFKKMVKDELSRL